MRTVYDELDEVRRDAGDVLERARVDAGVGALHAAQRHVVSRHRHVTGSGGEFASVLEPGEGGGRRGLGVAEHRHVVALVSHDHVRRTVDQHRRRYATIIVIIIIIIIIIISFIRTNAA